MPYSLPNGVKVATPQELGIDPNDKVKMAAYADFFQHLSGTLYNADRLNNTAKTAAEAGVGYVVGTSAASGGGGTSGGDGGSGSSGTSASGNVVTDANGNPVSNPDDTGNSSYQTILNDLQSVGGDIVAFAKQYGTTALEAANIIQSAERQKQSDQYAKDALNSETASYATKAPLRTAGQAGMLNPGANTPDLSNIRNLATAGSGNPFAKSLPVAGVATKPPGYDVTGKLNTAAPSLPVAGSQPLPQGITPSGNPLPPGAQAAIDAASHAGTPTTPGSTTTVNYGGQQYTPAQWSAYQQQHPDWSTPTATPAQSPRLPVAPASPIPSGVSTTIPTPPVAATPKLTLPVAPTAPKTPAILPPGVLPVAPAASGSGAQLIT